MRCACPSPSPLPLSLFFFAYSRYRYTSTPSTLFFIAGTLNRAVLRAMRPISLVALVPLEAGTLSAAGHVTWSAGASCGGRISFGMLGLSQMPSFHSGPAFGRSRALHRARVPISVWWERDRKYAVSGQARPLQGSGPYPKSKTVSRHCLGS